MKYTKFKLTASILSLGKFNNHIFRSEQAIQQLYCQDKGIDTYYHISKSIMSLNYVSYVVI